MSENKTSQSQQEGPAGSFDPLKLWTAGLETWTRITRDNVERLQSFYNQAADLESATYERAKKSAKELGDMVSESVTYVADLSREWRKVGIETARRSARVFRTEE